MKKIGIALSGGGARGLAHLGILKALEEFNVKPDILSGTSAGAIAGAFYAKGYSIDQIVEIVKNGHFFGVSNFLFKEKGLFSMKGFKEIYSKHFPSDSFDELNIPMHIAATDILNGQLDFFSSGSLSKVLMASSCVPLVFKPIQYNDTLYVDGGIMNNFPVEPLIGKCDILIGIEVNSIKKEEADIHKSTILDRSFHLAMSASVEKKREHCDLFLQPKDMSTFGMFDIKKFDEIFQHGYAYGKSQKDKILALIHK